jgi:hypothetical protein
MPAVTHTGGGLIDDNREVRRRCAKRDAAA